MVRAPVPAAPLSGEQYEIAAGPYRAVAVGGGGGIRRLSRAGRDLLDGYDADALADGARGQVLAPWPNRLRDGRWSHDGAVQQLPLDDAQRSHAIHGLVRWVTWQLQEHTARRVVLRHRLQPRPGYPFALDVRSSYTLDEQDGLHAELSAENVGGRPAPVALGVHPYLAAPDGERLDACTLQVPARTRLRTDEHLLPVGTVPVEGTEHDLREGRALAGLVLDDAYTDLETDEGGRVRVRLTAPSGRTTELWADRPVRWLQLFTGDTLRPSSRRRGVAVEPMTAPANALQSGDGLVLLRPGDTCRLRWGVADRSPSRCSG